MHKKVVSFKKSLHELRIRRDGILTTKKFGDLLIFAGIATGMHPLKLEHIKAERRHYFTDISTYKEKLSNILSNVTQAFRRQRKYSTVPFLI